MILLYLFILDLNSLQICKNCLYPQMLEVDVFKWNYHPIFSHGPMLRRNRSYHYHNNFVFFFASLIKEPWLQSPNQDLRGVVDCFVIVNFHELFF